MATHLAAVSLAKGSAFELQTRPTPKPGPGELLIEVKSVAINPADGIMRDQGLFIPTYPTVIGFDISGLVLEVGDDVPVSVTHKGASPCFQAGITRVAAYAAFAWKSCDPDYGAFQERCLVPWQHAVPLPKEGVSWNEAATLPVAVQVPLSAWDAMGLPRSVYKEVPAKQKKDVLLIWGASSSVGTMGVQSARLLREDLHSPFAAVYATAGAANQEYVTSLGADRVFDYKEPNVVDEIVRSAKEDGLRIQHCFLAMGKLAQCQTVLRAFVDDNESVEGQKSKIVSSPPVPADAEKIDGLEVIWVMPSADEGERLAQYQYWMGTWLRESLANRTIRPSPEPQVVGKGVGAVNAAVDCHNQGTATSNT